ncbi:MAG: UDP-N-acetylmuramate dehydrogenase [Planctomycetota bacterium]|jgi:UDP-N-acetylmuramate dehydrogenase
MNASTEWPCPALSEADLGPRTTMRIGGRIQWLLEPSSPQEFGEAWRASLELGIKPMVIGGGANLLIEDGDFDGVVISTERLRRIFRPSGDDAPDENVLEAGDPQHLIALPDPAKDPRIIAWAGATIPGLVRAARDLKLSGVEGLIGVPGQIGGGIAMNAGGKWGDMWDVVERIFVLEPDGSESMLERDECSPTYRNGGLGDRILMGAVLRFEPAPKPLIEERMRTFLLEKNSVQPVTESSCGCIFKNPDPELSEGRSAGKLIDDCGGKSLSRGAALVSPLHANFIINTGGAKAADVWGLVEDIQARVADQTGVQLSIEVRRWVGHEGELRAFV